MKAIIPAAGLGTRLLPLTKAVPKELFPVQGKPAIQWVLEEGVRAGLNQFVVVVSPRKPVLRQYLTPLEEGHPLGDRPALAGWESLLRKADIRFVEQPSPLGLGDALLRCQGHVGEEPFALLLPDNICPEDSSLLGDLIALHRDYRMSCVAIRRARPEEPARGCFLSTPVQGPVYFIKDVVPSGGGGQAGDCFHGIGRYVLDPEAFTWLERAPAAGELNEVPALLGLARRERLLGLMTKEAACHLGARVSPEEYEWSSRH
jgi:UTP--glucose-1-phosphate uridylyltransferase